MTVATESARNERSDVRTIVGGGVQLGVLTSVGVAMFALFSRVLSGGAETVVQTILVLAGGVAVATLPAAWIRPRGVDGVAWAALTGLLGALAFTVIDTTVLRPLGLYHWTWDEIGGGSGFWYIPVWWMLSAVLAWLGAWGAANAVESAGELSVSRVASYTAGIAVVVFLVFGATPMMPFHAAFMGLSVALALVLHVPLAKVLYKR